MNKKTLLIITLIAFIVVLCTRCDNPNRPSFTKGWEYQSSYFGLNDTIKYYYSKNDSSMIVYQHRRTPVKIVKSKAKLIIKP